MRKPAVLIFVIAATAVLSACGSGSSGNGLTGKDWHLTAISEKSPAFQGVVPVDQQANYTINFAADGGTFSAKADCNQVSGSYVTSGSNGITITPGPSTMAFCGEGSFGDLYVHGLGNATTYAIASDQLTLTLKDGGTMTFGSGTTPAASAAAAASMGPVASPSADLTGKTWQLTAITEQTPAFQGVVPADQQADYTIEFKPDGSFASKADCNQVSGTYTTTTDGGLAITIGATTRAYCGEGSMSDLYILGLSDAASYEIADGALTITLAGGGTLVYQ